MTIERKITLTLLSSLAAPVANVSMPRFYFSIPELPFGFSLCWVPLQPASPVPALFSWPGAPVGASCPSGLFVTVVRKHVPLRFFREVRGLSVLLPTGHASSSSFCQGLAHMGNAGLCGGGAPRGRRVCPGSGSSLDGGLVVGSGRLRSLSRRLCQQLLGHVLVSQRLVPASPWALGVGPNCSTVPVPEGPWVCLPLRRWRVAPAASGFPRAAPRRGETGPVRRPPGPVRARQTAGSRRSEPGVPFPDCAEPGGGGGGARATKHGRFPPF